MLKIFKSKTLYLFFCICIIITIILLKAGGVGLHLQEKNTLYSFSKCYSNIAVISSGEAGKGLEKLNNAVVQDSFMESESEMAANKRRTIWIIVSFLLAFIVTALIRFIRSSRR
jgi:hypothetical protein